MIVHTKITNVFFKIKIKKNKNKNKKHNFLEEIWDRVSWQTQAAGRGRERGREGERESGRFE